MDGVINVYKPLGMTSFDVVRKIKQLAKTKKVGHTGTLDPKASGVLPVCIGKATGIVDYIMNDVKIYKADLKLGIVTDTYDTEGKVLENNEVNLTEEVVASAIKSFVGDIKQIPPMYSALKVNGTRLYDLARQGIEIERESRNIKIYDINIIDIKLPYITFEVKCSKGTYIRSLCYDIGRKLQCGGTMWALERTASSIFKKNDSINLMELSEENIEEHIIPIEDALKIYEKVIFDKKYEKLFLNGVAMNDPSIVNKVDEGKFYRIYLEDKFIGIGAKNNSTFKMVKLIV